MITTIPLNIVGETWYNPQEFRSELDKLSGEQYVLIDLNSEGPALLPFGIYDILSKYSHKYIFTKWSNPIESHPYGKVACSEQSHFFKLSWRYWINEIKNNVADNTFGLFIGRNSVARNYILYDVYHTWPEKFLLSKMTTRSTDAWEEKAPTQIIRVDDINNWSRTPDKVRAWWDNVPVHSIDDKQVMDQYGVPEVDSANCALSLLSHYAKFNFELIAETYTMGETFFPTEKTVRPIIGNKPFLIYGPKNYLRNLQQLGFKTFSSIWNEQYDTFEGAKRWQAMRPVINMICNWDSNTKQAVLDQCAGITLHNRNRLREIIDDNQRI